MSPQTNLVTDQPVDNASVLWIGHSLMETEAESQVGKISLLTLLGQLAAARGLCYKHGNHTLWGSSLSTLWSGKAHRYKREAPEMLMKRQELQKRANIYDTLVMTELIPISWSSKQEFTSFYIRKFACEVLRARPEARIFLYQGWSHLQSDGGNDLHTDLSSHSAWHSTMAADRPIWQSILNEAQKPCVSSPSLLSRFGIHSNSNAGCDLSFKINLIPVGDVIVSLERELNGENSYQYILPDGTSFKIEHFFSNPYMPNSETPSLTDANISEGGKTSSWALQHKSNPWDDIHPSAIGIYIISLISFSVIYQQTPVGLPSIPEVGEELAKSLQKFVWHTLSEQLL